jgi:hypothetical protein
MVTDLTLQSFIMYDAAKPVAVIQTIDIITSTKYSYDCTKNTATHIFANIHDTTAVTRGRTHNAFSEKRPERT